MKTYYVNYDGTVTCEGEAPFVMSDKDPRCVKVLGCALAGEVALIFPEEPIEDMVTQSIEAIAEARWQKERAGVVYIDAEGGIWAFDTSIESQNRHTAAIASIHDNTRVENSVWKCASIDAATGAMTLAFRPTTNAELQAISALVSEHVQKCFEAEALATSQVMTAASTEDRAALSAVNYADVFDSL